MACTMGIPAPPFGRNLHSLRCRVQPLCDSKDEWTGHICIADEHYLASVLSAYEMKDTLDHIGYLSFTDWSTYGGWHPAAFFPGDSLKTLHMMRSFSVHGRGCALWCHGPGCGCPRMSRVSPSLSFPLSFSPFLLLTLFFCRYLSLTLSLSFFLSLFLSFFACSTQHLQV